MRLSREQRAAFFKGEFPRITYPGAKSCPVEKGETYRLSSLRQLVVTGIRRSRKGEWVLLYEVHQVGSPLYLAARAPKAPTKAERDRFTKEQAHGYTRSRSRSLDPNAECIDLETLREQRNDAEAKHMRFELERAGELLRACEMVRAAVDNLDPEMKKAISRELWTLRGRIDALKRKLRQKAAA